MSLHITEIIGLLAFSLSGFLVALDAKLDLLGVLICAFCTALIGGLIRDTLAGVDPYVFIHAWPALLVVVAVGLMIVFKEPIKSFQHSRLFIVADSIGLVSFAHTGALVAIGSGFNLFGVIVCAFMTAVGGGLVRDVILNKVPFFMKSDFYAVIPIFIAVTLFAANSGGITGAPFLLLSLGAFLALRLCAVHFRWRLPVL
ncbi:MAG: trimeric intracellular cation channel family protein [Campylobacterota bacterium]